MDHFSAFDRKFNLFSTLFVVLFIGIILFNVYQVSKAPDCPNGALIQDDLGRFVCVDPNDLRLQRVNVRVRNH